MKTAVGMPEASRLLVVEDDRGAARLLELDLAEELGSGVSVTVVETLAAALDVLKGGDWAACVLDLGLPDSQGLETLRAVMAAAPTLPVLVLSGDSRQETALEALRLGAEDFIDKHAAPGLLIARKVGHVVARQRLTREVVASRDGLQAVLDSAADGIVTINERGIVLSFNSAAEAIFGWRADEVIGRNVSMLMPVDVAARHDGFLQRYIDGGTPRVVGIGREVVGQRKDGSTFPLHLAVSDVMVHGRRVFTGIVSDLTELKAAQRKAEERGRLVEAILHGTPDPIFAKDMEGRYLLANEACCAVFGMPFDEVVGKRDTELNHCDVAGPIREVDRRVLSGEGIQVAEEELPTPEGMRTFSVTKGPLLGAGGAIRGLVGVARDVTDILSAQRELTERNRLLALTEEVAHVGHWYLDVDGEQVHWSRELFRIHGLDPATFVPTLPAVLAAFEPSDREAVRLAIAQALADGKEFGIEARLRRADGGLREVLVKGAGDLDGTGVMRGLLGILFDITELRQAQSAVAEAADLLRLSIGALKDAFVLYDPEERMVVCNEAYERLIGTPLPPGTPFVDVLRAGIAGGVFVDAVEDADQWLAERVRAFRRGGTRELHVRDRWYLVTDVRLASGHVVGTRVDITALREARVAAESANRAKSEFLSRMSHELRTPLNAILGFAELMETSRKDPPTERQKSYLGHIRTGGGHLLNLINDVLDLARIEAGGIGLSIEPVDPRALLDDCLVTSRTLATRSGVTVHDLTVGTALPWLSVDLTRAKQVLLNLLSNAVKYNRPSGTVTLSAEPRDGCLRVSVADTGWGIPASRQDELFQPFSRLGRENGEIEGTGIGLTITRRLVDDMGGAMGFTSSEGEGSTFWVDLPLAADAHAGLVAEPITPMATLAELDHGRRVLYVEDNPANLALMEEIIDELGDFVLTTAQTGEDGVAMALADPPDVVLMDINLPGMDGFGALAALQADPRTRAVPVIALSADAMPGTVRRGEQAGFVAYLTKPVRVDALMAALEQATDGKARVREGEGAA
ncbi:PAS domain S-box protein [Novispirillum sp. DQ9]|uniref:PAS domain S-box protein n=1 Tax=Novispirillum sp. DQ9 TaxID=3398612 RepID=UPI003C79FC1F